MGFVRRISSLLCVFLDGNAFCSDSSERWLNLVVATVHVFSHYTFTTFAAIRLSIILIACVYASDCLSLSSLQTEVPQL